MTNFRWLVAAILVGLSALRVDAVVPTSVKAHVVAAPTSVKEHAVAASSSSSAPAASSTSSITTASLCQSYPSTGICADYVNYQVAIGNIPFSVLESNITNLVLLKNVIGTTSPVCVDNFYRYACSLVYPKCGTATSAGQVVYPACKSTCNDVISTCTTVLTQLQQQAQLPNCATAIAPTILKPLQDDGYCNYIAPKVASTPVTNVAGTNTSSSSNASISSIDLSSLPAGFVLPSCPSPFIKDPLAKQGTNNTSSADYCRFGCCIPCPAQNLFYKKGWLDYGFLATDILRAISAVTSGIMLVSYLVLPEKRRHPSVLILLTSLAIFLFSAVVFFVIGNPKRIQCASEYLPSDQSNNLLCTIQGAWLIFSSFATAMWICALILNLHIHTVWNSSFLVNRYITIHIICWGVPAGVTAAAVALHSIKYEFASLCLVSVDWIFDLFFYPLAVVILPSFLIHMATFFHIARISMKEGMETEMSQSRSFNSQSIAPPRVSHRRHVITAVRIQWRALLLAIVAVVTVVFYWIFYFTQVTKLTTLRSNPQLTLTWIGCMMSDGGSQDSCHATISDYLPPYPVMIAAESAVSLIGLWLFIIFAKRSIWVEWADWWYDMRQSTKTKEKSDDQFLAL